MPRTADYGNFVVVETDHRNRARVYVTSALVGVAGSFIGFHLASLLRLSGPGSIVPFICAAVGAAVTLLGWRMIKL
jgi:uncharacterized membrane protein YeaQ/YmgE (transglycosylase-associated protein family)